MGLQLKRSFEIVLLTRSYILHRAAIYAGLCACAIVYLSLLSLIGAVFGSGAFWALLTVSSLIGACLALGGFLGEFLFSRLKIGHIALIAGIMAEGRLPEGISQVKWARNRVAECFEGVGPLTRARRAVRQIVRAVNHAWFPYSAASSVPGFEGGAHLGQRAMDFSQRYIEEAVMACAFRSRDHALSHTIKTAIILYCHCAKDLLKNAVLLTLLGWGFFVVASVAFLVPLGIVAMLAPHGWTLGRFVLFASGLFLGLSAKWALFDPVACASTILTFFDETELVAPDPEWEERVDSVAKDLDDLEEKLEVRS